jgi:lipopolysaccharide export system permease protein
MPILARYILRTVFGYTALVLAVLLVLGGLFLFISEQDDIGTGTYGATQAMTYVIFNLPTLAGQLLPVAALIGALLGLGNLARGSELVVMRASGVTSLRFCIWLAVAGSVLALLMAGLGEFVAPPLEKYARQVKVFSKFNEFSIAGSRDAWVRDGNTIISVAQQSAKSRFGGVQLFRFGPGRRLIEVGRAEAATVNDGSGWRLEKYSATRFPDDRTEAERDVSENFHSTLSPDFLGLAVVDPQAMGMGDLWAYIQHLRRNDLDSGRLEIVLWSRVARFAALLLVVILALPFSLGPMRATGQGARTVVGILIGAAFVLLSQTLENSGLLLGLPPVVTGWLPTALLGALTLGMLVRAR